MPKLPTVVIAVKAPHPLPAGTSPRPQRLLRVLQIACAATVLASAATGCALLNPRNWGPNPLDHPAHPLTDDQAMTQVVDLAKEIDNLAQMDGVDGGFSFASCNDQGDPPYRVTLTMGFLIHGDPDAYFQTVVQAMVAHGWNQGVLPGQHYHGTTLNKDAVVASVGLVPSNNDYGQVHLYGECRVTTDHHHDPGAATDITSQLSQH